MGYKNEKEKERERIGNRGQKGERPQENYKGQCDEWRGDQKGKRLGERGRQGKEKR